VLSRVEALGERWQYCTSRVYPVRGELVEPQIEFSAAC
jgi:hypothetical protein